MKEKFTSALKEVPFWCLTALKGYAAYQGYLVWKTLYSRHLYRGEEFNEGAFENWVIYFIMSFFITICWRRTHLKRATIVVFLECAELFWNLYMSKYGFYCYLYSYH